MASEVKFRIKDLNFYFGEIHSLKGIDLEVRANRILAVFGPAMAGKTTFLRTLNRLNDLIHGARHTGEVILDGEDIYAPGFSVPELRRRVGMVFAIPTALPMSILDNMAYGPRLAGITDRRRLAQSAEWALEKAALWDEVKDRLRDPASRLSGGQQQRLSIARVLALEPEVILLDEPASGLDPISTLRLEESLQELKESYTIVIVCHSIQQAARIGDDAAFFLGGELIEWGPAANVFTNPQDERTEDYITGRFG